MIELKNFLSKFHNEQRGSVVVMTAVLMFALIGFSAFVLDFGVYYSKASKLQNALDSAVLAAAKELPADNINSVAWITAENEATDYAGLNKFAITRDDIQPIYKGGIATDKIIGIKIAKSIVVDYNFAKVIGISSGIVTRASSAGLSPAGGIKGAIPLGVTSSTLRNAIEAGAVTGLTIKCSSNAADMFIDCAETSGWFGALQFEGSGASTYSNLLANGYSGTLKVGQLLDMENGNMSGPTLDGFTTRYNGCKDGCTAENYLQDCPRVVYVPVVEVVSASRVKIVSFATFFLVECGGNGKNSYIKATYIKDIALPNQAAGESGQDFGLYVSKLLD